MSRPDQVLSNPILRPNLSIPTTSTASSSPIVVLVVARCCTAHRPSLYSIIAGFRYLVRGAHRRQPRLFLISSHLCARSCISEHQHCSRLDSSALVYFPAGRQLNFQRLLLVFFCAPLTIVRCRRSRLSLSSFLLSFAVTGTFGPALFFLQLLSFMEASDLHCFCR